MKAVILAAGPGKRMRPLTEDCPKGLLDLNGETIVGRQVRMLKEFGIEENDIAIVTGYRSSDFEDEFSESEITLVENEEWSSTDNLYSFKLSRGFVGESDFLVINGDAIFSRGLLDKVLEVESSGYPLDMERSDEESIKVEVEDGRMTRILGKNPESYDGVTTEVFKISSEDSENLFDAADRISEEDKTQWFDSAVDEILDYCYFKAIDVSGEFWREVDNPQELQNVRKELKII